jgi:hypothetical protein
VEAKINNLPVAEPQVEKKPAKGIDLMDALRRSLAQMNPKQAAAASEQSLPVADTKAGKPPKKPAGTSTAKSKAAASAPSAKKPRSA